MVKPYTKTTLLDTEVSLKLTKSSENGETSGGSYTNSALRCCEKRAIVKQKYTSFSNGIGITFRHFSSCEEAMLLSTAAILSVVIDG